MASPWASIAAYCVNAEDVTIVSPYMKEPVLKELLNLIQGHPKLECFCRWTPQDIWLGTTDTACRQLVIERGGQFFLHKRLHAKYYRFDHHILIGSANCTAPGLNYKQTGNLEILCSPDLSFDRTLFESQLRSEATEVSDEEMAFWLNCPVKSNTNRTSQSEATTNTLEDWKPLTRFPEYLWLIYSEQREDIPDNTQRERAIIDLDTLRPPPGLQQEQFNHWITASLFSSPFIASVVEIEPLYEDQAWAILSQQWGLQTNEAARARATAQNWLKHFGRT